MAAPPKDSVTLHAKLDRAEEHIRKLQDFWSEFVDGNAYPHESLYDPKIGKHLYRLVTAAPIPVDVPLMTGDAIHNIRSALDHAAYRLVCVGTKSSGPFDRVYFPISDTAKEFKARIRTIKKYLRSDAIKPLTEVQAHPGGHGKLLWHLNKLNNIDKHRLLLTVSAQNRFHSMPPDKVAILRKQFLGMADIPETSDYRLFLTESQTPSLDLKGGHILGIFSDSEVQEKMHFPIEVAFGEPEIIKGKPVVEFLWLMFQAANTVIMEFDALGLFD
jgi:hypothetical protein